VIAHLWPRSDGDSWRARLEVGGYTAEPFFQRLGEPLGDMTRADALLVATLLIFMSRGAETVRVHGPVSRVLLRNLDELQCVWTKWRPNLYRKVVVEVDEAVDDRPTGAGAISAFSGGVDAAFTVYRHCVQPSGWHTLPLREVVMVQGFDVGLGEPEVFQRAVDRSRRMLAGTNLVVSLVRTNIRGLSTRWGDHFALAVASVLLLFADRRDTGLIGSGEDYASMFTPCGSTPVQDWMASTGSMAIRNDGAGYSRTEKVAELCNWPAAPEYLRVCYRGADHDRNCGRCEKCVRTMLNFEVVGHSSSGCFDNALDLADLRRVYFANGPMAAEWKSLVREADRRGIDADWVAGVRRVIRREQLKATPVGQVLKRFRTARG